MIHHLSGFLIRTLNIGFYTLIKHIHSLSCHLAYGGKLIKSLVLTHEDYHLRYIRCMVSYSLHVSNNLHCCRYCTQILCHRLLLYQQVEAHILYQLLLPVYHLILSGNLLSKH